MKQLSTSIMVTLLAIGTIQTYAQDLAKAVREGDRLENKVIRQESPQVSQLSRDAFYGDFGKVGEANWSHKGQLDEVAFVNNGVFTTAFYDFNNKLIGSTVGKTFAQLPDYARKSIDKNYKEKGYEVGDIIFFDDNENNNGDALLYGSEFSGVDHYFITVSKGGKKSILMANNNDNQVYFFKAID